MNRMMILVGALLGSASLAAPAESASSPISEQGKITLDVPAPSRPAESLSLRVMVGPLPRGARIVVRSSRGEVLGAISPFGAASARAGGAYLLPISEELLARGKLSLTLTLEEERGMKVRPPTEMEVKDIRLHPAQ